MNNKDNKKHKLSIYLIKQKYKDDSEIIPKIDDMKPYEIKDDKGVLGMLYVKTGFTSIPKWAELFSELFSPKAIGLETKSARAVLIANVDDWKLCLTFGHAHFLINPLAIVRNFGLKVALNIGGENTLRAVDKTSLDFVAIQTKEQSSKEVGISNFAFNLETDILKSITAKDEEGASILSGRDAVSVSAATSLRELRELLQDYLEEYNSNSYKKKFSFVDHIIEERDKSIIEKLNEALIDKISTQDHCVWLSIPEIVIWEEISGFAYKKRSKPVVSPDIHIKKWFGEVAKDIDINVDYLKRKQIYLYDVNYELFKTWTVYHCLNAEIDVDGHKYILNDTSWYEINNDYVSDVNDYFESIEESTVTLPPFETKNEPEYNEYVVESYPQDFALMDCKTINVTGKSPVEFCDLFTKDKKLIHVKKYGSSSVLSHLFQQGIVSGELFLSDCDFRNKVNAKLSDGFKIANIEERPEPKEYEICYAIMSDVPGNLHVPFFSKVVMKNAVKQLQTYGYKVTKKKISIS